MSQRQATSLSSTRTQRSSTSVPQSAFSLVEVVLSIAVISICLVAVVGLLSAGFIGMKNSDEQAAAGSVLEQIAGNIRNASTTNLSAPAVYYGLGICTNLTWTVGQVSPVTKDYAGLSLNGTPSPGDQRLVAHVQLVPPAGMSSSGTAIVSVAWPRQAQWTGNNWTNAQGSLSTYLIFLPRQ